MILNKVLLNVTNVYKNNFNFIVMVKLLKFINISIKSY